MATFFCGCDCFCCSGVCCGREDLRRGVEAAVGWVAGGTLDGVACVVEAEAVGRGVEVGVVV